MGIVASTNISFKNLYRGTSWGQSTSTIADVSTNKQFQTFPSITHLRNQFGIDYDASNPINGTQGTEWKASQTVGLYLADALLTQQISNISGGQSFGSKTSSFGYGTRYNPNNIDGPGRELSIDGELISHNGQPVIFETDFFGAGYFTDGSTEEFRLGLKTASAGSPPADIISSIIIQISGNTAISGNGQQDSFKLDVANASYNQAPFTNTRFIFWNQAAFGDNTAWTDMTNAWDGTGDMVISFLQ
jgi:hypothetical protein